MLNRCRLKTQVFCFSQRFHYNSTATSELRQKKNHIPFSIKLLIRNVIWPKISTAIVTYSISGIYINFRTFLNKNCDVWYYVISMVFTEEHRVVIKFMRQNKRYSARRFEEEFLVKKLVVKTTDFRWHWIDCPAAVGEEPSELMRTSHALQTASVVVFIVSISLLC